MKTKKLSSLCWKCAHTSASECSWFDNFTPVDGWDAIPVTHIGGEIRCSEGQVPETYSVNSCPNFLKMEEGK